MFKKKMIFLGIILFLVGIFIFNNLESKKIYIPYDNECGQPNSELILITLQQLKKVKKLHKIYLQEQLYKNKNFYTSFGYKIFNKEILTKYNINYNDFIYEKDNKKYNIFNEPFYEMQIAISEEPLHYIGFLFSYPNSNCNGLLTKYCLFFDDRDKIKYKNNSYRYIQKIEKNWYFMCETTINTNSNIFDNIFISKDTNKKWEYIVPPLEMMILPFDRDKLDSIVINNND